MTDISKIADAIINLINSNMRSPRKDEIEAVLREHIDSGVPTSGGYAGVSVDGWVAVVGNNNYASNATPPLPADCGNPIFSIFPQPHPDDTITLSIDQLPVHTCTQKDLEAAADAICARETQDAWIAEIANYDGLIAQARDVQERWVATWQATPARYNCNSRGIPHEFRSHDCKCENCDEVSGSALDAWKRVFKVKI